MLSLRHRRGRRGAAGHGRCRRDALRRQHPEDTEVIDGEIEGEPVDEPAPTPEGAPAQEKAA
jgi:hypothetical protein